MVPVILSKEEATKQLAEMVANAHKVLSDCEKFADQHDLAFDFYHEKSAFQDSYKAKSLVQEDSRRYYDLDDPDDKEDFENLTGKWCSSSANC